VFISIIAIISVLGVAVSVMVLDIVLAVMTGFEGELKSKLIDTSSHVTIRKFGGELSDWQQIREKVLSVDEVVEANPYTYNQAMLSHNGGATGLLIQGLTADVSQLAKLKSNIIAGSADQLFTPEKFEIKRPDGIRDEIVLPTIVIGKALAARTGIEVGQPVSLLAAQFSSSPQGLIPRLKRFLVVGFYSSGLVEYESGVAYASVATAQNFFGLGNNVTGLEVTVDNLDRASVVKERVAKELMDLPGAYDVNDWSSKNKPLYDALNLEKRVYFIVLLLLILVASFSIVSTLVMIVMEKSRDIAILKTLGAKDRSIRNIFLFQGIFIGVAGTTLGTILGILGCLGLKQYSWKLDESVFALSSVPVYFSAANFATVAIASLLITAVAGIYPARRAAKLRVADALRFE